MPDATTRRGRLTVARIPLPGPDEMKLEQRAVHDEVVSGPCGQVVGPLRAVMHSTDPAPRWSRLGEYLRYRTCPPKHLNELAISATLFPGYSDFSSFLLQAQASAAGMVAVAKSGGDLENCIN